MFANSIRIFEHMLYWQKPSLIFKKIYSIFFPSTFKEENNLEATSNFPQSINFLLRKLDIRSISLALQWSGGIKIHDVVETACPASRSTLSSANLGPYVSSKSMDHKEAAGSCRSRWVWVPSAKWMFVIFFFSSPGKGLDLKHVNVSQSFVENFWHRLPGWVRA